MKLRDKVGGIGSVFTAADAKKFGIAITTT